MKVSRDQWGEVSGERLLNGYRVSFWGDENILELGSGGRCTTLRMY